MASFRTHYSPEQLTQYFDRICLPANTRLFDVSSLPDPEKLAFLTRLLKHQLVKVPWENLTQHYSWHRVVNVKAPHLFRKIVQGHHGFDTAGAASEGTNRGGYCMEANLFFHHVLLSLGFDVYLAGSRIYSGSAEQGYGGWTHIVNLVTIAGTRYLLDGGFGPQAATRPLALEPERESVQIAPARSRLRYEALPQMLNRRQKVWVYQHRYGGEAEWKTMYCFSDLEFTPRDVESMNFAPWRSPQTFFTHQVVGVRFTVSGEVGPEGRRGGGSGSPGEEALEGEIDGALALNQDVLKWRRHGEKVLDVKFNSEAERLEALRMYFGIRLREEDVEAIKGAAAEVGGARGTGDGD